jgi:small-conductance mechanosensitive channel
VILRNGRILLGVVAVIVLSQVWNVSLEAMASRGLGTRIAESLFDIVITLILASAGWGILKTAINRQLPHETLDALAMADGEVLGTGLSRLETLLPLLRKFVFVAMIVVVAMIVISSLGINIGPLLAGAGVVGIAVGFGAQTLVRDILSGIFFLVDDAFRIGEYIDVGEGKGTVERMSIRALMLRHQLGQINTIPFGVIRRVTNYSRDWAIMKLELRVPFDTDLEKVRKIVKQVGKEMLADPEYGPNFIQPLKSQGVHRMDDSSFIVRVKFMAKPGEQFLLRREVFHRIQGAFQRSGIKFAPRRVIVDAPATLSAGAAAAVAAEIEGEAESNKPRGETA